MKKRFFMGGVVSLCLGLGACTAGFLLPNSSPVSDWDDVTNGMSFWDDWMKNEFPYKSDPDWCESKHDFFGESHSVDCYILLQEKSGEYVYGMASCYKDFDRERICRFKQNQKRLTAYQVGKYKRFFGREDLLPQEELNLDVRAFLFVVGFVLVVLVAPLCMALLALFAFVQIVIFVRNKFKQRGKSRDSI